MATFNIDDMKSGYQPVDIIFRGQEYVLGKDALGILDACEVHGKIEDKDGVEYLRAFFDLLPELVKVMCPELDLSELELETGEQMALMRVTSEVLSRVGRLTFPAEESAGNVT